MTRRALLLIVRVPRVRFVRFVRAARTAWLLTFASIVVSSATAKVASAQPSTRKEPARFDAPRLPWTEVPFPRLPAPFLLPDLSHRRFDIHLDTFTGAMIPVDHGRPTSAMALFRVSGEAALLRSKRLFVGATVPFASALPPDGALLGDGSGPSSGARRFLGNLEAHVRAVFPLPSALEIGLLFAVSSPTARFERSNPANLSASTAAISMDPTNFVHFLPGRVALRPAADLRILRGRFVFQARQGVDILVDDKGIETAQAEGRILAHVGWLAKSDLEVSLEASQVYFFFADAKADANADPSRRFEDRYRISDERRTALTIGPGIRWALSDMDLGASVITSLSEPLSPAGETFVGLRISLIAHLGRPRPW